MISLFFPSFFFAWKMTESLNQLSVPLPIYFSFDPCCSVIHTYAVSIVETNKSVRKGKMEYVTLELTLQLLTV